VPDQSLRSRHCTRRRRFVASTRSVHTIILFDEVLDQEQSAIQARQPLWRLLAVHREGPDSGTCNLFPKLVAPGGPAPGHPEALKLPELLRSLLDEPGRAGMEVIVRVVPWAGGQPQAMA
jgi:hypothetical protein